MMENRKPANVDFQELFDESKIYLDYSDQKFKESQERMQHTLEILNQRVEEAKRLEKASWYERFANKLGLV